MIQQTKEVETRRASGAATGSMDPAKFAISFVSLLVVLGLLFLGYLYLSDKKGSGPLYSLWGSIGGVNAADAYTLWWVKILNAIFAIIWGVIGVAAVYYTANGVIESFATRWRNRIMPYLFVGPAIALLFWVLTLPTLRTLYQSFFNNDTSKFVGIDNYVATFTDSGMLESFRNNLIWLFIGTTLIVVLGLLIAVLADRSKFETVAKALIFLPMAISLVGAGVIWRFVYAAQAAGQQQIGILNAILGNFGIEPQTWLTLQPWNNLFLIIVQIWAGTGFAMVLFSAAIKGVPIDLQEAARVDGATEVQAFFSIVIPYIQGTIITVTTTTAIGTLKIFDVVYVMTGGQFGTSVIGTEFYRQFFTNSNYGYGSAIAIVLFICISPVLVYNLRQFGKQEGF